MHTAMIAGGAFPAKRAFLVLAASVAIALTALPTPARADEPAPSASAVTASEETGADLDAQAANIANGTWGTCPWVIDSTGKLTVHAGKLDEFTSTYTQYENPWRPYADKITSVSITEKVVAGTSLDDVFSGFENCTSMNLSGLDTSATEDMSGLFCNCLNLTSLDVSHLDTSSATATSSMFENCGRLTSLDVSGFDTSKVRYMSDMFKNCISLTKLTLGRFDTSSVLHMTEMFYGCRRLASLDVSGFDTSQVTGMSDMFENCSSLKSLDLSSFRTSRVTQMYGLFDGCMALTSLDLRSFDTSNVNTMKRMFYQCGSLKSLDLSSFDTSKAKGSLDGLGEMFVGCPALAKVSLGASFTFRGDGSCTPVGLPTPSFFGAAGQRGSTGRGWVSASTGHGYSGGQVAVLRDKTADTYTAMLTTIPRFAGDNALGTMESIINASFNTYGGTVVLATKDGYWDALTASGVAGLCDAPVILTDGNNLSIQAYREIERLKPSTVIICGGTDAIGRGIEINQGKATDVPVGFPAPRVIRCAGADATGTACQLYKQAKTDLGKSWSTTALIATSTGYWDALSIAPYSYSKHCPIFLTKEDGSLSDETLATMRDGGIKSVYLVGGTAVVPEKVRDQLASAGISVKDRLAGSNAVGTSEAIAEFEYAQGMKADKTAVATVDGYWDALSGAALCGRNGAPLLLVSDADRTCIDTFVKAHASEISSVCIFGGAKAVSNDTADAVAQRLN